MQYAICTNRRMDINISNPFWLQNQIDTQLTDSVQASTYVEMHGQSLLIMGIACRNLCIQWPLSSGN